MEALTHDIAERDEDKVVEGKDGWLFLARDTNHVIHQHTGRLRFSQRTLEDWRHVLETRFAWLAHRRIPYFFLVPPNTHAVYPEYLPDDVVTVAERPVLQLLGHLRERNRRPASSIRSRSSSRTSSTTSSTSGPTRTGTSSAPSSRTSG